MHTSPPFMVPLTTFPKLPSPSTHSEPSAFVQTLREAQPASAVDSVNWQRDVGPPAWCAESHAN